MGLVNTDRISIGATREVHDVGYDSMGNAFCLKENRHHWKYGDEHWAERSKKGFITFGDKHLGMAVQHKIAVYPNEGYIDFWSRMRQAEDKGHIEVMGTSAYSAADEAILSKELGIKPDMRVIDQSALVGMSTSEGDKWRNVANGKKGMDAGGVSMVVIAAIVAIGYLLFVRRKRE